jgi:hypothetical protein
LLSNELWLIFAPAILHGVGDFLYNSGLLIHLGISEGRKAPPNQAKLMIGERYIRPRMYYNVNWRLIDL